MLLLSQEMPCPNLAQHFPPECTATWQLSASSFATTSTPKEVLLQREANQILVFIHFTERKQDAKASGYARSVCRIVNVLSLKGLVLANSWEKHAARKSKATKQSPDECTILSFAFHKIHLCAHCGFFNARGVVIAGAQVAARQAQLPRC